MIVGVGIDVASIERMRSSLERYGDRFWERILTPAERQLLQRRADRATALAGRWAAKEAGIKAFGGEAGGVNHDFEVLADAAGAPRMVLHGKAAELAEARGVVRVHVSITHDAGVAAAVVVLEGRQ